MRRVNTVVSALMIVTVLLHGVLEALMMANVIGYRIAALGKPLAHASATLMIVHVIIAIALSVQTAKAQRGLGKIDFRQNASFWARRFSGLAILLLLAFHPTLFGATVGGQYTLFNFDLIRLTVQLVFTLALAIHIFTNVRPLLMSLGIVKVRARINMVLLMLSALVLLMAMGAVIYYIGWLK